MKFGLVVANIANLVANDYKSHVVVNGVVTFWLVPTSDRHIQIFANQTPILIKGYKASSSCPLPF